MAERDIQAAVLRVLGTRRSMRIWRHNTGAAVPYEVVRRALTALRRGDIGEAIRVLATARPVTFGVPGQGDLSGIAPDGRRLEVEVKTPAGRQSVDQKNFEAMITRFGGVYRVVRSAEEAEALAVELEGR